MFWNLDPPGSGIQSIPEHHVLRDRILWSGSGHQILYEIRISTISCLHTVHVLRAKLTTPLVREHDIRMAVRTNDWVTLELEFGGAASHRASMRAQCKPIERAEQMASAEEALK